MHKNEPKGVASRPSQYFNYVKGTERSTELTQELGGAATTIPASALHSFQSEGACGFSDLRSWKPIDSAVFNASHATGNGVDACVHAGYRADRLLMCPAGSRPKEMQSTFGVRIFGPLIIGTSKRLEFRPQPCLQHPGKHGSPKAECGRLTENIELFHQTTIAGRLRTRTEYS